MAGARDARNRRAVAKARLRLRIMDRIPMPRDKGTPWSEGANWPQALRPSQGRYTPPAILSGSRMNGG
jgi:hypothetical protein